MAKDTNNTEPQDDFDSIVSHRVKMTRHAYLKAGRLAEAANIEIGEVLEITFNIAISQATDAVSEAIQEKYNPETVKERTNRILGLTE